MKLFQQEYPKLSLPVGAFVYWLFWCLVYALFYGINDGVFIVFIGCISLFAGAVPLLSLKKREGSIIVEKNEKILLVAYLVLFLINIFLVSLSLSWYRMGYTWGQIRSLFLEANQLPGPMLLALVGFVVPCTYLGGIVFAIEFLYSKSKLLRKLLLVLTSLSVILYGLASQGRFVFLYFLICVGIAYYKSDIKLKSQNILKRYAVIAVIFIFGITVARRVAEGSNAPLYEAVMSIIEYALLPFDLVAYYTKQIDNIHYVGHGMIFLGGFMDILQHSIGSFIDLGISDDLLKQDTILSSFNDEAIEIHGKNVNAFVSMFTYFYIDGKIIGVAVESAICGFMCALLELKRKQNVLFYSFYLFAWLMLAMSPVRWGFAQMNVAMCVFYLYLFFGLSFKVKKKRNVISQI